VADHKDAPEYALGPETSPDDVTARRFPGLSYPVTRRGELVEEHHGEQVADPYRWLEDTGDEETRSWVAAQNALTESFLAEVLSKKAIRAQLTEMWDYPKLAVPFERGGHWFQSRNSGLQNQPVLYVMDGPLDEGRVLLDPNTLSLEGTVAIGAISVSRDGSKLAYATSRSGSDWLTWHVRVVTSGADLDDVLIWSKSADAQWQHDGKGFYYVSGAAPRPGREYLDESREERIFFHVIGTSQLDDELVFAPENSGLWPELTLSADGRYLVVSVSAGIGPGAEVSVLDLECEQSDFKLLVPAGNAKCVVVANKGDIFYLLTDDDADRGRIVAVDLNEPGRSTWREVVAQCDDTLLEAHFFGGRLVCHYLCDACSLLRVFELDGTFVRDIPVPEMTTLAGSHIEHEMIEGSPDSDLVLFELVSFSESASLWSHDLSSGLTTLIRPAACLLNPERFVTERVRVTSADGTKLPMFLSRRRDVTPDGEVPVLLYGYGGGGICITPSFSVPWAVWLERGGMLAVASLRGGGEYGRSWHEAGKRQNKQNVFDDFCACARWLASSGWSRPGRIAINGRSNGGLLIGACLTQHPELFGAAVAEVGVHDMLRFHRFTVGWAWKTEHGDPEDPDQYVWLRRFSPLHNVIPRAYPPTLVTTGDHDDRVVPGHSFKFAAALQAAQQSAAPVLLRVDAATGHGGGKPTSKSIEEAADRLSFVEAALLWQPIGPEAQFGKAPP
jgi:prolyl oligopeptidase